MDTKELQDDFLEIDVQKSEIVYGDIKKEANPLEE